MLATTALPCGRRMYSLVMCLGIFGWMLQFLPPQLAQGCSGTYLNSSCSESHGVSKAKTRDGKKCFAWIKGSEAQQRS